MNPRRPSARFVLGVDVGQTAVKAVLHDERMSPVAVGRRASPVDRPRERHAERSQDALWAAAADAIGEAVHSSRIDPAQIAAVAITGHGDGLHLVDARGDAVGPAITAVDSRAWREAAEVTDDPERLRTVLELSGQQPTPGGAGPLLLWMVRHEPAMLDRARTMLFCKDVVRLRLTGLVATDLSDATASFLDTRTASWSPDVLAAYGLTGLDRMLPELRLSADPAGTVTRGAAGRTGLAEGTPVIIGLHDVQAASLGMGALIPDRLALVAGSFSTNGVTTTRSDVDPRWQSRLSITPDLRIAMSTSPTASPSLEWLLALLGVSGDAARDALFAEATALPPEEGVPLVLPYLYSSPVGPTASATLAGVRGWHSRAHVLRGMLEGIALMHHWHTSALGEKFDWQQPVVLGGGLARSPLYVRLVAGVLRSPVQVVRNEEVGAFGAAALAGVAAGLFESVTAVQDLVEKAPPVEPTAASADYWAGIIGSFDSLGAALDPWWGRADVADGTVRAGG
ncbi:MAG: carbohydrate kinase [Burkholderiaceae bacterium]|nr:carbohydrate kinase [Microbacteriaceae bacterium]